MSRQGNDAQGHVHMLCYHSPQAKIEHFVFHAVNIRIHRLEGHWGSAVSFDRWVRNVLSKIELHHAVEQPNHSPGFSQS